MKQVLTEIECDTINKIINFAQKYASDKNDLTKAVTFEGALESIKSILIPSNDVIGASVFYWMKGDIVSEFEERFGKSPTDDQIEQIITYIDINGNADDSIIQHGLSLIDEAFDKWELKNR